MRCETLFSLGLTLGEGPIWSRNDRSVYFVDILEQKVHRGTLDGNSAEVATFDEPATALFLTSSDEIWVATPSGIRSLRGLLKMPLRIPDGLRPNDGKVAPDGRIVVGSMGMPEPTAKAGSLWSYTGDHAQQLLDDVTISNGLCWSRDSRTMYYIDTPTQRVVAFDYDTSTGQISNRRTEVEIPQAHGSPDGMTIDTEGGLWVALWGGSAVRRYLNGHETHHVEVPTPYVTCPVFAGPQLDQLVVTTASAPFTSTRPSGAGDVYVARTGFHGHPADRFAASAGHHRTP